MELLLCQNGKKIYGILQKKGDLEAAIKEA